MISSLLSAASSISCHVCLESARGYDIHAVIDLFRNSSADTHIYANDVLRNRQFHIYKMGYGEASLSSLDLMLQWTDAFQPGRGDARSDVAFEKASLLFNLGAISSQVALGADLASEKGVKAAARSYQVPSFIPRISAAGPEVIQF